MMEAARTSETLVDFYQTTRRYNPEDSHLSIKIDVKEIECGSVDWIELAQYLIH
jgi:hypothetical protein